MIETSLEMLNPHCICLRLRHAAPSFVRNECQTVLTNRSQIGANRCQNETTLMNLGVDEDQQQFNVYTV
jgi:hypothetical protein